MTCLEIDVPIFVMTYSCQHHLINLKGILQFSMRKKLKSSELNWIKRYVASTRLFKLCTQTFNFEQVIFCSCVKDENTYHVVVVVVYKYLCTVIIF